MPMIDMNETITWTPCPAGLPDTDLNVLAFDGEEVREAFLDCDANGDPLWRDVTAVEMPGVTHWAEMPGGPSSRAAAQ